MDKKPTKINYFPAAIQVFGVAFEMGFIIAVPVVLFGKIGKHLDTKYDKSFFVYLGIVLALLVSFSWIYARFSDMIRRLNEAAKKNKNINTENKEIH
jgi:hypothetical protein